MKKEQIGRNANIIWEMLDDDLAGTELDNAIKKSKLKNSDFYMALGWLAKENKVEFHTTDKITRIFLKD
jgi:hypothetical protein